MNNGPYAFNIYNVHQDYLTIWVHKHNSLPLLKRNEPKLLGSCDIQVQQLIMEKQTWFALRKDTKPAGQVLIQIEFRSNGHLSTPMNKIL